MRYSPSGIVRLGSPFADERGGICRAKASADGAPYLGEAQPLATGFVKRLFQELGNSFVPEILPEYVLAFAPDLMIWWMPRFVRRMFFRGTSGVPEGFSGRRFSQPALVWMAREGGLYAHAICSNRRPDAAPPLMIAPYWDTDGEMGRVCYDNMRVPDATGVAAMPQPGWLSLAFRFSFRRTSLFICTLVREQCVNTLVPPCRSIA